MEKLSSERWVWEKETNPLSFQLPLQQKGEAEKKKKEEGECKYDNWKLAFEQHAFCALHDILKSLPFSCFFKLYFDHISCIMLLKITFMFFLGEKNVACDRRREYYIMKSKMNREIFWMIHQEAQRWYVFAQLGGTKRLLESAKHYKIRLSQANDAARLACCWHLTSWENETAKIYRELFSPSCSWSTIHLFLGMMGGGDEGMGAAEQVF